MPRQFGSLGAAKASFFGPEVRNLGRTLEFTSEDMTNTHQNKSSDEWNRDLITSAPSGEPEIRSSLMNINFFNYV